MLRSAYASLMAWSLVAPPITARGCGLRSCSFCTQDGASCSPEILYQRSRNFEPVLPNENTISGTAADNGGNAPSSETLSDGKVGLTMVQLCSSNCTAVMSRPQSSVLVAGSIKAIS